MNLSSSTLFANQLVAISGSVGGLGRAVAKQFHSAGANLLLIDRDENALTAMASEFGERAQILRCDQSSKEDVQRFSELGMPVDVFINNAAITVRKPLEAMSFEEIQEVIGINLSGSIAMAVAAAKMMLTRKNGVIVNVASQLGIRPSPGRATYGASKAALIHFTKSAAAEWTSKGIRVVGIAPGPIDTPMVKELLANPETAKSLLAGMPIGRLLSVDEVASLMVFLASPAAASIVGETIVADGGNLLT